MPLAKLQLARLSLYEPSCAIGTAVISHTVTVPSETFMQSATQNVKCSIVTPKTLSMFAQISVCDM